ncbi:hypothetical protein HMPREF0988_01105 [Lachnospiraceae bacterium 1_4_56FAA]|nr:hypothetical protein HMPREF0988_01105 [Lachnospiraceae bacterium 1_4_56FAA]
MNYTYILQCSDGTYYTGWTNDLEKRLDAHNTGKGAKYTKTRRPVTLMYYEMFATKEEAMKREYAIKQLNRKKKTELIEKWRGENKKTTFCRKSDDPAERYFFKEKKVNLQNIPAFPPLSNLKEDFGRQLNL